MGSSSSVPNAGYVCGMSAGIFLNPATISLPLRQNRHVAPASAGSPAQPLSRIAYGQLSRPMPMKTLIWIAA